jgi:F-type H+-transporting ATPase subunit alpha
MLARGSRLTELLKQAQFSPFPVEEQVVSIFAGTRGYLDTIAIRDVVRFERELLVSIRSKNADILDSIRIDKELKKDTETKLAAAIEQFVKVFA